MCPPRRYVLSQHLEPVNMAKGIRAFVDVTKNAELTTS